MRTGMRWSESARNARSSYLGRVQVTGGGLLGRVTVSGELMSS